MDDLGNALNDGGPDIKMLGGGQPGSIPEMNAIWRRRLEEIMGTPGAMEAMVGNYDPPKGNPKFIICTVRMPQYNQTAKPHSKAGMDIQRLRVAMDLPFSAHCASSSGFQPRKS